MRYIIATLALVIILTRILFPTITFDGQSLTLFLFSAIVLLIPDIGNLIQRIRKVKVGGVELELSEELKQLANQTAETEKKIDISNSQTELLSSLEKELERFISAGINPKLLLIQIAIEIEKVLFSLANQNNLDQGKLPLATARLIQLLSEKGVLDQSILPLFKSFWSVRNKIVHGVDAEINENQVINLTELGRRLLLILKTYESRSSA